ncbi:hypothetical protein [Aliiroseovarius sp.]|uniref:hypothetical protein n=1 Tax=Aliiroseovarius sp. TaxID=1872442 RepID=UPI003BA9D4EE
MSTYASIQQTPMYRLQAQMAETRLVKSFRADGLSQSALSPRVAAGRVKRIRHWQDGRFVTTPLYA